MDFDFFLFAFFRFLSNSLIDLIALCWFITLWAGYSMTIDKLIKGSHSLSARMHLYRVQWMHTSLKRENRIIDINIINSISQSTSFFASTSILIIAGFLAILSATDTALNIIRDLPFATQPTLPIWYTKVSLMIILFVYAFFKYTWSMRQLNYAAVLIGAMPLGPIDVNQPSPLARQAATIVTMAGRHMNRGLRTYYYAIAALCWFISPWLFMIASGIVVWVLYRREFSSDIVQILNMPN